MFGLPASNIIRDYPVKRIVIKLKWDPANVLCGTVEQSGGGDI